MKQKALGTRNYNPPDGLLLHDIETAWDLLQTAEHEKHVALNEQLMRLAVMLNCFVIIEV